MVDVLQKTVARWLCDNLLDPFDPSGKSLRVMKRCLLLALLWLVPADAAVQSVEDLIARERIVALASHVAEIQKRVEQRFEQAEHAVNIANTQLEKRLDSINEFRGQLKDQQSLFITKAEVDQRLLLPDRARE